MDRLEFIHTFIEQRLKTLVLIASNSANQILLNAEQQAKQMIHL
ncbi:hypothetical protein [Dendronalium phyllosphericum]|nr:hypothetical protein [Dendronalium phyllosphericum]